MDIGALRHRVTLEVPGSEVPTTDGGFTQQWTVLAARIPAAVIPATALDLERLVANTVQSSASHLVTLRYLPGVTTKTRVIFHDVADRTFTVSGTHDFEERHEALTLECQEVVA